MKILLPTKHSHPDRTTIAVATLILQRLKHVRLDRYDDLVSYISDNNSCAKYLFLSAMNFLFLLGLVEYHTKNDSFEYIGL